MAALHAGTVNVLMADGSIARLVDRNEDGFINNGFDGAPGGGGVGPATDRPQEGASYLSSGWGGTGGAPGSGGFYGGGGCCGGGGGGGGFLGGGGLLGLAGLGLGIAALLDDDDDGGKHKKKVVSPHDPHYPY